ncbi:MAG TPA: flagellar biosynthesis protein FlhA [Opitutae bacterium]|nr:flagellar biosynthesis protein FlhA [Opitutae bacterium]
MSAQQAQGLARILKNTDLAVTFGLFGIVLLLVLPVTPMLLDLLLVVSIGISLLVLLIVIYLKEPSEFSVFPTLLLAITLYRLGLNVASTRLILLDGFAGNVINAFGNFVVRGDYVVGAVVFLILVVINFVVITKGSGRIAEVAARFTLDAMPGKQMAIDAELNSGIINEIEANERRLKIQKEADFYGSMDGASKFVRGDAVAGILITLINVIGGIAIGVFQKGLPLEESLHKYTLLSIGDGLVSQIPALIVSVGAGILVTRTSEGTNLGQHLGKQIILYPRAVGVAAVMMMIFALFPGMPGFPFGAFAVFLAIVAYYLKKNGMGQNRSYQDLEDALAGKESKQEESSKLADAAPTSGSVSDLEKMIKVEPFTIELGYGLLSLADRQEQGELLERITGVRQKFARDMGVILPPIAVKDNLELGNHQYAFLLRNRELKRGELMPHRFLAMNVNDSTYEIHGSETVEPVFGLKAYWITEDEKTRAEMNGYTVVDASSVLITHLSETLKESADLLIEREDVQKLIELTKEKNPTLVSELIPEHVNVGLIQRVLQNLLHEKISIKNFSIILETIGDFVAYTKNPDELSEQVRRRLGVYFIQNFETEGHILKALTLDPRLEQTLMAQVKKTQFDVVLMMDPVLTQKLLQDMTPRIQDMAEQGMEPVLITTAELRLAFKRFFEPSFQKLNVLSYQELPNNIQIQNVGILANPLDNIADVAKRKVAVPAIN